MLNPPCNTEMTPYRLLVRSWCRSLAGLGLADVRINVIDHAEWSTQYQNSYDIAPPSLMPQMTWSWN